MLLFYLNWPFDTWFLPGQIQFKEKGTILPLVFHITSVSQVPVSVVCRRLASFSLDIILSKIKNLILILGASRECVTFHISASFSRSLNKNGKLMMLSILTSWDTFRSPLLDLKKDTSKSASRPPYWASDMMEWFAFKKKPTGCFLKQAASFYLLRKWLLASFMCNVFTQALSSNHRAERETHRVKNNQSISEVFYTHNTVRQQVM